MGRFAGHNVVAGLFTFYLVSTAAVTVMRRRDMTRRIEVGLLMFALVVGSGALIVETLQADADFDGIRARVAALCDRRPLYPGFRGWTTYVA